MRQLLGVDFVCVANLLVPAVAVDLAPHDSAILRYPCLTQASPAVCGSVFVAADAALVAGYANRLKSIG